MARLGGIDTQYFTDEGDPLSYGLLYCYETGTTTPKGTFHDSALTVPNTWPIELDAIGVPPDIFFSGTAKFVLKDSAGTTLRTLDPVIDNEFQTGDTIILRLGDIDSQFFDQNGDILALGKLYLYENGTSTPKDTYSDNALTALNDWPVELDSTGFLGDVFFEGKARLVLTDQYGVQQRELDDVDTFDISYLPGFLADCPGDTTARIGSEITFCVEVSGDAASYTYQWYQDLTLIVDGTERCFTKIISAEDDGTRLWVTVSDGETTEQCGYLIITAIPACAEWTEVAATVAMSLLRSKSHGSSFLTSVSEAAGLNGIIAVNNDRLWFVERATNSLSDGAGEMYTSSDFGASWTICYKPEDENWNFIDGASFSIRYPTFLGWNSMRYINGEFYATLGYIESKSVWTSSDGQSWNMIHSTVYRTSDANNATYYDGEYLKQGAGGYMIGAHSGKPYFFGKWAAATAADYTTLQIGGWTPDVNPGLDEWYNTKDVSIVGGGDTGYNTVSDGAWIYQYVASSGLQAINMSTIGTGHKVATAYWAGANWSYTTTGSWLESSGLNAPFTLTTGQASPYHRYASDGDITLVPHPDFHNRSTADFGKAYQVSGTSTTLIDFSGDMSIDAGELTTGSNAAGIYYIKELGAWILYWAPGSTTGTIRTFFWLRMGANVSGTIQWSNKVKYNLPSPWRSAADRIQVEYSQSQNKFVFGGHFNETTSPNTAMFAGDNVFECV